MAAITHAPRQLATDPEQRAVMGRAARATALEKFDHHRNAALLYDEIKRSQSG